MWFSSPKQSGWNWDMNQIIWSSSDCNRVMCRLENIRKARRYTLWPFSAAPEHIKCLSKFRASGRFLEIFLILAFLAHKWVNLHDHPNTALCNLHIYFLSTTRNTLFGQLWHSLCRSGTFGKQQGAIGKKIECNSYRESVLAIKSQQNQEETWNITLLCR